MMTTHTALTFFRIGPARRIERHAQTTLLAPVFAVWLLVGAFGCSDDSGRIESGAGGAGEGLGGTGEGSGGAPGEAGAASAASGAGGGTAQGGAGGVEYVAPVCVPGEATAELARIVTPNPRISVGLNVAASDTVTDPELLVDGLYHRSNGCFFGLPTPDAPAWAAVEVGTGPSRLLVVWHDPGWNEYDNVGSGAPAAYRIETSADSTDGSDGTWTEVVTVAGNPVRGREHSIEFADQSWVRFVVTEAQVDATAVRLDELAIFDISDSGSELPDDTWFFMGDSITQGAFMRNLPTETWFENVVNESRPDFYPAVIGGGIGGDLARNGLGDVEQWLELNPDIKYFAIAFGTNDSWGNKTVGNTTFESDMQGIIDAVLSAGRVPILARIPYSTEAHETLEEFNAVIDRLQVDNGLPCGPDLYGWYFQHPGELDDGVHPTREGYVNLNRLWAEAADALYPSD